MTRMCLRHELLRHAVTKLRCLCLQAQHVGSFKDQLEVRRVGSAPCEATVTLEVDWQPERFALDPRLAVLLRRQYDTKVRWHLCLHLCCWYLVLGTFGGG